MRNQRFLALPLLALMVILVSCASANGVTTSVAPTATPTVTPTAPAVTWSPARKLVCNDFFNPTATEAVGNQARCTGSNNDPTLEFKKSAPGYPELDIHDNHGPSSDNYKVSLLMDLSKLTESDKDTAGCILGDTRKGTNVGAVVCVKSNGYVEVLDARTMGSGSQTSALASNVVKITNPAEVPVTVQRTHGILYALVNNQLAFSVASPAEAGNIGFLLVGNAGSLTMTNLELADAA